MKTYTEIFTVVLRETVECYKDCWDYISESHYTEDWEEEQSNSYDIELELNEEGEFLTSSEVVKEKILSVQDGTSKDFDVVISEDKLFITLWSGGEEIGEVI
jgi:hypothetical protein